MFMYTYNSTYSAAPIVRGMILFKEICYLQRIVQIVLVSNIIGANSGVNLGSQMMVPSLSLSRKIQLQKFSHVFLSFKELKG